MTTTTRFWIIIASEMCKQMDKILWQPPLVRSEMKMKLQIQIDLTSIWLKTPSVLIMDNSCRIRTQLPPQLLPLVVSARAVFHFSPRQAKSSNFCPKMRKLSQHHQTQLDLKNNNNLQPLQPTIPRKGCKIRAIGSCPSSLWSSSLRPSQTQWTRSIIRSWIHYKAAVWRSRPSTWSKSCKWSTLISEISS